MTSTREAVETAVERLLHEVATWEGITVHEHRFGGTEWRVGPREIGHVHAWGMLDIAYLRALRDVLVEAGETGVHHILDDSGWTTFYIESPGDYDHARWLVRLSYLYHVRTLQRTPVGAETFAAVDVDHELAAMDLSADILAAIERRRPDEVGHSP